MLGFVWEWLFQTSAYTKNQFWHLITVSFSMNFFLSAYLNKSNAQNALCNYKEAIDTYLEALAIDPDNSYILYCIGESYLDLAELDLAESYLLKSTQISDLLPDAWVSLATVYEEKSQFDPAISCLKKAIELDPDNVELL